MSKDSFKAFVKNNPNLVNYVKNNEMSWQKFYEMYDLYGEEHEIWKSYLNNDNSNSIQSTNIFDNFKSIFDLFKGVDLKIEISVLNVIVTSAYVMLIGSFVPIPGGTGGLEFGFIAFFGNFIIGPNLNAIMLLWRFVTYYFGMILGSIVLSLRKKE